MKLSDFTVRKTTIFLLITTVFILNQSFTALKKGDFNKNNKDVIHWNKNSKLSQSDFKALEKGVSGDAAATTASGFGYSITDNNGEITGSIYVQFYCDSSWWNPEYKHSENRHEILKHEQLHFDICELFGRRLFKEVLKLKKRRNLTSNSIEKLSIRLEKEYTWYQDKYDYETNHSMNREAQAKWNKRIKKQLNELSDYDDYQRF